MSYAGPRSRNRSAPTSRTHSDAHGASRGATGNPAGAGPLRPLDLGRSPPAAAATAPSPGHRPIVAIAGGVLVGLVVGAGLALLAAPASGADVRHAIARRGQRAARRGRDAWDDLRHELQRARRHRRSRRHERHEARELEWP